MAAEHATRRKLAELVAHHVLGHVDLLVVPSVVDEKGTADEVRNDRGGTRPGLDGCALFALPETALEELVTNVKALDMDEVRKQIAEEEAKQAKE